MRHDVIEARTNEKDSSPKHKQEGGLTVHVLRYHSPTPTPNNNNADDKLGRVCAYINNFVKCHMFVQYMAVKVVKYRDKRRK